MYADSGDDLGFLGKSFLKKAARAVTKPVTRAVKPVAKIVRPVVKPVVKIGKVIAAPTGIPYLHRQLIKKPQMRRRAAAAPPPIPEEQPSSTHSNWGKRLGQGLALARAQGLMVHEAEARANASTPPSSVATAVPATSQTPLPDLTPPSPSGGGGGGGGGPDSGPPPPEQAPPEEAPKEAGIAGGVPTPALLLGLGVVAYFVLGKKKGRK